MTSISVLDAAVRGEAFVEPLTTEQYHRMIESGVLLEGAPIELIDGIPVRKDRRDSAKDSIMTVGPGHRGAVQRVILQLMRLIGDSEQHVWGQQPVHIPPHHEPEPDVSVVRGKVESYDDHHPGPGDLILVVEVADSSLSYDRGTKLKVYAAAGIPQYWIVNLNERCVEVHTEPDAEAASYQTRHVFEPGQTVAFDVAGQTLEVDVNSILPS